MCKLFLYSRMHLHAEGVARTSPGQRSGQRIPIRQLRPARARAIPIQMDQPQMPNLMKSAVPKALTETSSSAVALNLRGGSCSELPRF